jgi:hypothetical protein
MLSLRIGVFALVRFPPAARCHSDHHTKGGTNVSSSQYRKNALHSLRCSMTRRAESRFFWRIIFCCGLLVAALPFLIHPILALSVGGAMAVSAALRLWMLRRRAHRDPRT